MNSTFIKFKVLALGLFLISTSGAQEKLTKVSQSIKVDKDVTIDLSISYCNIEFDTWNKNAVEIEAYIEGDGLSKEELQEALKNWDVDINAATDLVSIKTKVGHSVIWFDRDGEHDSDAVNAIIKELKFELADLPDMDFDFHFEVPEALESPEIPEIQELPELPEGINNFHFDYEAYKKEGDKYLEEYTKQFESKFGKDFARKMEVWGEKFGKAWEEKYADKMEAWGERYAEQMEHHAERIEQEKMHEKLMEKREKLHKNREQLADERRIKIERLVNRDANSKVKKTIKIKMPKNSKLKVNVRHGELKFATSIDNLKANLSHTKFVAESINGSNTSINASYSPIYVTNWNIGELNLNYVENANLENVGHMVLNTNSSNIKIANLLGNALIDSSIGDLEILKIDDGFSNLNMILQNTNAIIALPKVDYSLQYKGNRTRFAHPKKAVEGNSNSFSLGSLGSEKNIVVNAKYGNVVMK